MSGRIACFLLVVACAALIAGCGNCNPGFAGGSILPLKGSVYTTDSQFDQGTAVSLNHDTSGTLRLNETISTHPNIWIALSARNTICRINTETGVILGEYRTSPENIGGGNPSRTTVALDGTCWAGNRGGQSVIHVGIVEANQGVDRNGNGTIETSSGYDDVLGWENASGVDDDGGVETALDEAILHYVRTSASAARHVTVDKDNNVWVSGRFGSNDAVFNLIDGATGAILRTEGPFSAGGYGGLIDSFGIIWSASSGSQVLRWDPNAPLSATNPTYINVTNYGMAVDNLTNIWVGQLSGNLVHKLDAAGMVLGSFGHGSNNAQGLAVTANNHVWVSSSLFGGTTVGHLMNDGMLVGNAEGVGNGSTGVAVDAAGKVWTANIIASNASRIDPAAGPLGGDGVTPIGAVDLTVDLPGASPYNYSDMTGNVALGTTSPQGTWRVVQDSGAAGTAWGTISWNNEPGGSEPAGTQILVEARAAASAAGLGSESFIPVTKNVAFSLVGRFIEVRVTLKRSAGGVSPVLSDVVIAPTTP
ncbi:MAG: Vgb family protein [Planctomycetaceae bacterium]